ncbi:MAG: hypothetical protein QOK11_3154 [Pseudonocardiales bacterium]|nr:hypothetical protein [Pseudonocardiales bacterium]
MQHGALLPYEQSLLTADRLGMHTDDGRILTLDVERWLAPADDVDVTVLRRCQGRRSTSAAAQDASSPHWRSVAFLRWVSISPRPPCH